jgi:flagellar biosynthesis/type III secretory pathway chaperone
MAFTVEDFEDLLRILEQKPEWQERMRRAILSRELLELPERLLSLVQQLIESDARNREQIAELTRTVQRHDEILQRHDKQIAELVQVVRELAEAQRRTEARLERLENRLEGEIGRQSGERYEREVVASAPVFFYGGQGGGLGNPMVQDQLRQWLQPLFEQGVEISHLANPFRADIIWWKGDRVMVVEVGIKVSRDDVNRAAARAELLRRAGVNATPAVIGEEWSLPDVQALAQQEGVEWFVGDGLSQGFLEFRKLPDGLPRR